MKKFKYWWQRKFLPYALSVFAYNSLRILQLTCKIRVHGLDRYLELAKNHPCILMLWHQDLLMVPYLVTKFTPHLSYASVVSHSRDGEVLRSLIERVSGQEVIRASQKKGFEALRNMVSALKRDKILLITPDGPRGPRKKIKPGIAYAAQKSGAYIIPFTWVGNSYRTLESSWDHFKIPKIGATLDLHLGSPLKAKEGEILKTETIEKHMLAERENIDSFHKQAF